MNRLVSTLSRLPSVCSSTTIKASAILPSLKNRLHSNSNDYLIGESLGHSLNLSQASIGQTIEVPYETTVGESHQGLWTSTFQVHDRLYTSTPFAQTLNLPSHILPFYMMLFKSSSMSHIDEKKDVLDLSYENAVYIRPAYHGDTLRQVFTIKNLKNSKNGKNTIVTVGCELINQKNQLVFSMDKVMLYPNVVSSVKISPPPSQKPSAPRSHLLTHILYNSDNLPNNNNLAIIHPKQLVLHSVSRPIGMSTNMALSTLFRWTHPSIYNMQKYKENDLIVPGGLSLSASISATSRGLFECLHERLNYCYFINKLSPNDMVSAMSFIHSIENVKEGIEEIKITTVGMKNVDISQLNNKQIPKFLFDENQSIKRSEIENLLEQKAPFLKDRIATIASRTIVRQSPFAQQFSIPLL